jgi:hypothetical protein
MPVRNAFVREDFAFNDIKIFHYFSGKREVSESIVIDPATVTADASGHKIVAKGSLLCRITATGAYGPYASGASDGRQTPGTGGVIPPLSVICSASVDVTNGPEAIGGYFAGCDFETANLTLFGLATATAKAAFPNCRFY